MDIKIFLLMNCAIAVYCQSTTANRNDASRDCEFFEDVTFETEINRRRLINLEQAALSNTAQAMHGMKSQVEEIRQQCLNETQVIHEVKSQVEEIRQQCLNETQVIEEVKSKVEEIQQQCLNETQVIHEVKSQNEEIRQQNRIQAQTIQDINSKVEEIRQQIRNQDQAVQGMNSQIEEIRQAVRENERRRACPSGFDYLPEVGSCYKVILERMTWDAATERCRQVMPGMHLAVITSQAEDLAIKRYLHSQFSGDNDICVTATWVVGGNLIWIGGQTKRPSQCGDPYVWKPFSGIEIPFNYADWLPGNPNCGGNGEYYRENCAQYAAGFSYKWNDNACEALCCFICELDL